MIIDDFKNYLNIQGLAKERWRIPGRFVKYCETNNIDFYNITYLELQNWLLSLKDIKKPNSFNIVIKDVKLFYRFLLDCGKIDETVMDVVKRLKNKKVVQTVKSYVTKEELAEIVQMGESFITYMDITKLKALLYFMFYTGLRRQEICKLKREHIDLDNCVVIVKGETKNKLERVVPFPKKITATKHNKGFDFVQLLRDYFASEGEITNAFNMSNERFLFLFESIREFAPEKKITPHIMRHSFARMLARKGIDSRIAQKLLGHKNITTTMIYYDPDIDIIQDIYKEKIK